MRLLILGTGGMARAHADGFSRIEGVEIVACADLDKEKLATFAILHNIEHQFHSLDEALAWDDFDAVANVTPDKAHYATTMKCLAAGKHVFCEKPLATDYAKATEMADTAEEKGLVGMVNLTYRNVSQIHRAREMVEAGLIGELKHVEASYLQSWLVQPAWGDWREDSQWLWRLSTKHGSNGVLGDVGIHILDFAVYGAHQEIESVSCRLHTFDKAPGNKIQDYVLDANDSFAMTVQFNNGAIGVVHASRWAAGHMNDLHLRLYGDKGGLEVMHNPDGSRLRACVRDDVLTGLWRDIECQPVQTNYERFAEAVKTGFTIEPSFRHAAELQNLLDISMVADDDHHDQEIEHPELMAE